MVKKPCTRLPQGFRDHDLRESLKEPCLTKPNNTTFVQVALNMNEANSLKANASNEMHDKRIVQTWFSFRKPCLLK